MDHITVSGQVVPVPSNWSDADIKNFAAGIKSSPDHITIGGQAYAVPSSWTDKSIQDYANALKTGMKQTAPKQAPGFLDQLRNDPVKLVRDTGSKMAKGMNVENIMHNVDEVGDSIRNGTFSFKKDIVERFDPSLDDLRDDTIQKVNEHDYSGAAANVLPFAFGLDGGAIAGDVATDAARVAQAGKTAQKYGSRVVENSPAVGKAAANVGESMAPNLKKGAIATTVASGVSTMAPGLGHLATGAITLGTLYKAAAAAVKDGSLGKLGKSIGELVTKPTTAEGIADAEARSPWLQNNANQTYADVVAKQQASTANAPAAAPVDPVKGAPVRKAEAASQPMPTTKVEISSRISPDAATSTMGTKAPASTGDATASYLQGIRNTAPVNGNALDAATHQKLIDATRNGKLEALPADTKVALTRAVKAGDSAKVQSILDDRLHSGVSRVDTSVVNKVAALSKYAIDHSLDLNDLRNSAALVDKFVKDNNLGNPTSKQLRTAAAGNPEVLDAMNQMQSFSDAAYGHSVTKHGLIGNKRGRYDGVSLDTIDMVQRTLASVHK